MKKKNNKVPKFAEYLLKLILPESERLNLNGDYEEIYSQIVKEKGKKTANFWIWKQIVKSLPIYLYDSFYWGCGMFKNYLKSAVRNFKKQIIYSLINLSGLIAGITVCCFIFLWVQDEMSYDKFHDNKNRIYRVTRQYFSEDGKVRWHFGSLAFMFAGLLKNDFPEVKQAVRLNFIESMLIGAEDEFFEETGFAFADKEVFDVFTFDMLQGNKSFALENPFTAVITEEIALKYFGRKNPMGERLSFGDQYQRYDLTITGIIKSLPKNSHFHPDFLVSISTQMAIVSPGAFTSWGNNQWFTYILLPPNYDHMQLQNKLETFVDRHQPPDWTRTPLILQKLTDIHLHSHLDNEIEANGNILYVYIFSLTGLFILVIACINYMNLATSRSINRAKEVGLRKVVGAEKRQLVKQFFFESMGLTFVAALIAVIPVICFLPFFNDIVNKDISVNFLKNPVLLFILAGIFIFTGITSGTYPAVLLASFKPVDAIKSPSLLKKSNFSFRTVLVIFQFSVSIILIICVIIISNQVNYIRSEDLGFNKEHVVILPAGEEMINRLESLKEQLLKNPNVLNVTAAKHMPSDMLRDSEGAKVFLDEKNGYVKLSIAALRADFDYIPTFKIPIAAGRNFSKFITGDAGQAFILNEEAVKRIGWKSPDEAIGKEFMHTLEMVKGKIIGVIKNFHFESLHNKITPFFMEVAPERFRQIAVRISPANIPGTIAFLKETWKIYRPDYPFKYSFLDTNFDALYKSEENLFRIFSVFSILAVLIACLGLLGLASFTAVRRTKEIGIRKVLGASMGNIIFLLTKNFIKWLALAALIAIPVSWYAMNKWLNNYAYRINIGVEIFAAAVLIALFVVLISTGYQSIKAAAANPVKSLKNE